MPARKTGVGNLGDVGAAFQPVGDLDPRAVGVSSIALRIDLLIGTVMEKRTSALRQAALTFLL